MFRRRFPSAGSPGPAVDVRRLHASGPRSELPCGAQGSGRPPVNISVWQRKGERHCHHSDGEEEEEEGGEEEQPFLPTAEF